MRILNKKTWPYKIVRTFPSGSKLAEQMEWCKAHFGHGQVAFTAGHVYFKSTEDMTYFSLKWG